VANVVLTFKIKLPFNHWELKCFSLIVECVFRAKNIENSALIDEQLSTHKYPGADPGISGEGG
jgi:hypothetical protein